jgi:hypothetical protein
MSATFSPPPGCAPTLFVHDDHSRPDAIELAVFQPPQDVLDPVGAPSEVGGIPAEEICVPVREQRRVIERAPPPGNRIADKIHVDAAGVRLAHQFGVRRHRIRVGSWRGTIRPGQRAICRLRQSRREHRPRQRVRHRAA